jgi:CheY-like chemotaxis protein
VRVEAVKALRHFPDPRTYERLGQILGADVDGEVRRVAETVRQEFIQSPDTVHQKYPERKVLLIDDERYVVPPLVDALERQDIEVRVVTKATELQQLLDSWKPDVVVCELVDVEPGTLLWHVKVDDLPGLYLAKLVREKLGPDVPIIATSKINPEGIAAQLTSIHSFYVHKPTTTEAFLTIILSLFPPQ